MPPKGIKIYQICKTQSLKISTGNIDCLFHAMNGTFGFIGFCQTLTVKDVIDLSNGNTTVTGIS